MKKICTKCLAEKEEDDFHRDKSNRSGRRPRCKECECARARKWHADNREKSREIARRYKEKNPEKVAAYNKSPGKRRSQHKYDLKTRYGISIEEYEKRCEEQSGACAACGDVPDHKLVVDHCHTTGRVRGLLCRPCNTALGFAGDDPLVLRSLAEFAERYCQGGEIHADKL